MAKQEADKTMGYLAFGLGILPFILMVINGIAQMLGY